MSWDVIAGRRNNVLLGSARQVRSTIAKYLDGVDWSDPCNGIYFGDDFSYEVWLGSNVRDEDPIEVVIFAVRGHGDPLPPLVAIARAEDWSLVDASSSEELDLEAPSRESWDGYRGLVRAATRDMRRRGERPVPLPHAKQKKRRRGD
jgi:hypothetical protein